MKPFKCDICAGSVRAKKETPTIGVCEYCLSEGPLLLENEERIVNLFNRANQHRKNGDFDKAIEAYENVLIDVIEDNSRSAAHWGLLLCKYGVEFVIDSNSNEKMVTCYRTQVSSVLSDEEYVQALKYADSYAAIQYERIARQIERVQKDANEIVLREAPYDVFICYKETDDLKNRTEDSEIAQDIYDVLRNEGYRVFYSRVTMKALAGDEYEPYIFAALHSSKVMIVIGTEPTYMSAVWVKNEWIRFLSLMKSDRGKKMIICYKYFDPEDMPKELRILQAYNLTSTTFSSDLLKRIQLIIKKPAKQADSHLSRTDIAAAMTSETAAASLKRADIFLSNRDFENARIYYSRCLDTKPECSLAYWGQLTAKLLCTTDGDMISLGKPLLDFVEYKNAMRFASNSEKERYTLVTDGIKSKISDTISELRDRERLEVRQTSLRNDLINSESTIDSTEEYVKGKLNELSSVEKQLATVSATCKNLIDEEITTISQTMIEAEKMLNHLGSNVSASVMKNSKQWLSRSDKFVQMQYGQLSKKINESHEFREYYSLRSRQAKILDELNAAVQKVKNTNHALAATCRSVQNINSRYDRVCTEVDGGDYSNTCSVYFGVNFDAENRDSDASQGSSNGLADDLKNLVSEVFEMPEVDLGSFYPDVIECPACGEDIEINEFILASGTVTCSCGEMIEFEFEDDE